MSGMITFGDIRSTMNARDWDTARAMDLLAVESADRETINEYVAAYKPAILARCARVALLDHAKGVSEGRLAISKLGSYRFLGVYAKVRPILAARCPDIVALLRTTGVTPEEYAANAEAFGTDLEHAGRCAQFELRGESEREHRWPFAPLRIANTLTLDLHARFIHEALTWAGRGWITLDDITNYDMEDAR